MINTIGIKNFRSLKEIKIDNNEFLEIKPITGEAYRASFTSWLFLVFTSPHPVMFHFIYLTPRNVGLCKHICKLFTVYQFNLIRIS